MTIKPKDAMTQRPNDTVSPKNSINLIPHFLTAGLVALGVAIADEINQAYVPGRESSAGDVSLDMVGIAIALLLSFVFFKTRVLNKPTKPAQPNKSIP